MSTDLVAQALDRWKRKLLDLSKRNRLLNFKPTRSTTIGFADENLSTVFRGLFVEQRKARLTPASEGGQTDIWEDSESTGIEKHAAVDGSISAGEWNLRTGLTVEKFERSSRRIAEQAAFIISELGVNTLFLAMAFLKYFDADDSEQARLAPLILLPVTLERQKSGSFWLKATGEDPVLNPALVEYLLRDFGIGIASLPSSLEEVVPEDVIAGVHQAIGQKARWEVTRSMALGFFSFQKFVMFKDLERNRDLFATNGFLAQLLKGWDAESNEESDQLTAKLDDRFPPEETFQVVDADASQIKAIEAVSKGRSIVIIGPPGTGKSQTITNLIAHAMAQGKTVLFVSEKMAALKVVYGRLQDAGLAEFCLEVHSSTANKAAFYREIGRSLDRALVAPAITEVSADRLKELRLQLSAYSDALHTVQEPLGLTPFHAYGLLADVEIAPAISLSRDVSKVPKEELAKSRRDLSDFTLAWQAAGDPMTHAWRDSTKTYYSRDDHRRLEEAVRGLSSLCDSFATLADIVQADLRIPHLNTLKDAEMAATISRLLEECPGVSPDVLKSDTWNSPPPLAVNLIKDGRNVVREKPLALQRFSEEALKVDHTKDIELMSRLQGQFFRLLHSQYRATRKKWVAWRTSAYEGSLRDQIEHFRAVTVLQETLRRLEAATESGCRLFGALWKGEVSDWDALEKYVLWVVGFRRQCVEAGLGDATYERALNPAVDSTHAIELCRLGVEIISVARDLESLGGWADGYLTSRPIPEIRRRVSDIFNDLDGHQRWIPYSRARASLNETVAGGVLKAVDSGAISAEDLSRAFERSFFESWLDTVVKARPALRDFHHLTQEQRIEEFRDLDRRVLKRNQMLLLSQMRSRTQLRLHELKDAAGKRLLHAQIAKQRRHLPIREALAQAQLIVQAIKPCFMMSPDTVAQHLNAEHHKFDLVIFDEASQVTPEDAVGAIARGRQIVVAGDPKQLPPTDFFMVQAGERDELLDEEGHSVIEDMESVLDQLVGGRMPTADLKWHYRSRHESLISFSNVKFYDSELCTFPSADTDTRSRGIRFEYISDGVYEGAGINRAEARRVAEAVIDHARRTPDLTLGVGTFNLRQQIAIEDELDRMRHENPELEFFFSHTGSAAFFVKNLENIQGDDRDVIFLSVTYAKGGDGKLRHHFGPINAANGWRRLNVLITRARLKMVVFSSIRGDEIDINRALAPGARYLREFLTYAETGLLIDAPVSGGGDLESPFEREVYRELTLRGIRLVPQVGIAGYRVDFGVLDDEIDGRYICGIECDGAAYHSAETARDRDRLREEVLNGLGWTLHRVWSTDWFKDRRGQIERLLTRIEGSRSQAKRAVDADATEDPRSSQSDRGHEASTENAADEGSGATFEIRPFEAAEPYRCAILGTRGRRGVLVSPPREVQDAINEVVKTESPVHVEDVAARLAQAFGNGRVGSKISRRISWLLRQMNSYGEVRVRGDFAWSESDVIHVRSRAGTDIPADRIAPEEYKQAVISVLTSRGIRSRGDLIADVRGMLGFARTGPILEQRIGVAIDTTIADGLVGEGSTGLALRQTEAL